MTPRNLYELMGRRRDEIIERWSGRIRQTLVDTTMASQGELIDHIPAFVTEIVASLYPGVLPLPDAARSMAREHGVQRFKLGFDVGQVVREYGALVDCIVQLASEQSLPITNDEFAILSKYVADGVADAVSQYTWQRDQELQRQSAEHIGFIAHELRNPLATARLALGVLLAGELRGGSRAAEMLERSLVRQSELIETAMTQAWLHAGAPARLDHVQLPALLDEVLDEASFEADHKEITLRIDAEPALEVLGDRRMLRSVLSNLVQNALKFTPRGGQVTVRARAVDEQARLEVEDSCGGLPPGSPEQLFQSFVQKGENRSGAGLGLAIVRQAIEAHNGTIKVQNLPRKGCVFTVELPAAS